MELLLFFGIVAVSLYFTNKGSNRQKKDVNFSSQPPNKKYPINVKEKDVSEIILSEEQQQIFELVENSNDNIFITGKAGTGKSVLLRYIRQNTNKQLVICAPTGIAALNVRGQTIHSLFKIPPRFIPRDSLKISPRNAMLLRHIDTVVIDEISMVRADVMDAIDSLLRQACRNSIPFGGVQMVMFGDLYQLPPVVNDSELHKYFADNLGGFYFFNAHVWRNTSLQIYELSHIFRQKEEEFKNILNSIRKGQITEDLLFELNVKASEQIPEEGVILLAPTNAIVSQINHTKLKALEGKEFTYKALISGDIKETEYPTEDILRLKVGAQVMLLKNDKEKRWVNGTVGYVYTLNVDEIKVDIDGIVYSIPKETWSKIRYFYNRESRKIEEDVVSSFTQFPLRLAWAVTIHKSQGQTYEAVAIDMGDGAFAHGQTYVALSRCTTLERLYLKKEIAMEDVIVDPAVVSFMSKAQILTVE